MSFLPTPSGWAELNCEPKTYPNFEASNCFCLGDKALTEEQSKAILREVCRYDRLPISDARVVPLKRRCGVSDLTAIDQEHKCYCSEMTNDGTGNNVSLFLFKLGIKRDGQIIY